MTKLKLTAIVATVAAVAAASAAFAAIPDGNGVIHACYWTGGGGPIRLIDKAAGQKCLSTENALDWNQPGPQGLKGVTGDPGDPGAPGPDGLQGYEVVAGPTATIASGAMVSVSVDCPSGKQAIGGIFTSSVALGVLKPTPSAAPNEAWQMTLRNIDAQAGTYSVSAQCADAS